MMDDNRLPQSSHRRPDVSVVVPIYNAAPYLDQALDSVQTQSLRNIEILCINDGSTDNSLEIVQQHAFEDSRIRVFDRANHGYGAEMNFGIGQARGRYVAILEPDDWIESFMYKDLVDFADSFEVPIDIAKTPYWRIWMPDTPEQRKLNCSFKGRIHPAAQPFTIEDPGAVHLLYHHPSIWSALYRREFLIESEVRFREIPGAGWADNPFLVESVCKAKTMVYLDRAYYCYREDTPQDEKNQALNNTMLPFDRWNDMQDVLDELGVTNEGVRRAVVSRGFTYLNNTAAYVPLDRPDVHDAVMHMFNRMDDRLVMTSSDIPPRWKETYARMKGLPDPHASRVAYFGNLVRAGVYNLVNIGPAATMATMTNFFDKREGRAKN